MYGYRGVGALLADGSLRGSREAIATLGALFPVRSHFNWTADMF